PALSMRILSIPLVVNPRTSAAAENNPVFVSPEKLIDGDAADPAVALTSGDTGETHVKEPPSQTLIMLFVST
ncbi:MAG: hypothetical protein AABZ31_06370, partial [Bdellovibrionota bacterium]